MPIGGGAYWADWSQARATFGSNGPRIQLARATLRGGEGLARPTFGTFRRLWRCRIPQRQTISVAVKPCTAANSSDTTLGIEHQRLINRRCRG
jgi:hypothetical protein